MNRAVFLDRDGVINRCRIEENRPYPPRCVEEVEILPEVKSALERLKSAGFFTLVVTNQPDVARGSQDRETVEAIHRFLSERLPLDAFYSCFHDGREGCGCRKPRPGLILEAARRYRVDLRRSFMVGDRWRDVEAGARAGCRTIFLDYRYAEKQPTFPPDAVQGTLAEAVDWILFGNSKDGR